ncbi:MAG: hypothetical protein WDN27_01555 [Candidatus Saccharibacteria bacterium]
MPPLIALTDNFATADSSKWAINTNCTVTAGQLVITPDSSYDAYYANNGYDLTGKGALVQVLEAPSNPTSPGASEAVFGLAAQTSGDTFECLFQSDGNVLARERVGGSYNSGFSIAWPGPVWLRIWESGGTVHWDYSPDGLWWTNLWSISWTVSAITAMHPFFNAGYYAGSPSGTATFDNFNLPLVPFAWFKA